MNFLRRDFLKTAVIATIIFTLVGCAGQNTKNAKSSKPNIIYILADDLGYGDLGCYGQQRIQTPNLNRMAAEGIRFTKHYAGSTVCAPSRCALMTGLHTGHARIRGNKRVPLRPQDQTLAAYLKQAGYTTGLIGKWGLGESDSTGIPNRQGFDYFFGYLNQQAAHNYYPEYLWENETRIKLPNKVQYRRPDQPGGVSTNKEVYSHDLFVEKAFEFIEDNKSEPFFLYLALTIPHANNEAGKDGMEVPDLGIYKDKDWPEAQKAHAAMISRMDGDMGRIFKQLKDLGLDENTLVMFASDNGPHAEGGNNPAFNHSSGDLRGIKRDLYEGGIRVPFIACWPGTIKPGQTSDHISAFWDVLPTCTDLAGIETPQKIDGISFLPTLLQSSRQKQHASLYWEFHEQGGKQAVRMGRWKAVRLKVSKKSNAPVELYDLDNDPGEQKDIAAEHPDIVKKMITIMKEARTSNEAFKLFPSEE